MNKYSIILIILLAASLNIYAQEYFGVRAGLNLTTFTGRDAGSPDPKIGLHAGLTNQIFVHPNLVIQPELLYSMRGIQRSMEIAGGKSIYTTKLDYLELPVALKANIQTYHLQLQPYLAGELRYLLSQKLQTEISTGTANTQSTDDLNIYNYLDYGIALGMDLFINETVELGMRYNFGLADIVKKDNTGFRPEVQNYGLMISLGVLY